VRTVLKTGRRTNFVTTELEDILPEEIEEEVKEAAEISMGTEVRRPLLRLGSG
jgi:nucleolar protein 58